MKMFLGLVMLVCVVFLGACNVKEAAKEVGDAGNSLGKTIDDTINRDHVKKDNE